MRECVSVIECLLLGRLRVCLRIYGISVRAPVRVFLYVRVCVCVSVIVYVCTFITLVQPLGGGYRVSIVEINRVAISHLRVTNGVYVCLCVCMYVCTCV